MNQLTKETRQTWAEVDRREKGSLPRCEGEERSLAKVEAWARWKLAGQSREVSVDNFKTIRFEITDGRGVFTHGHVVRRWSEEKPRGPRGGFRGYIEHPERWEVESVIAEILLPEWALPVVDTQVWHEQHQQRNVA